VPFELRGTWGTGRRDAEVRRKGIFEYVEPIAYPPARALFNGFGFVDEHDGDIVTNFIEQLAPIADQTIFGFIQTNTPLAFGAGKNFKQFRIDSHSFPRASTVETWCWQDL
jgi:hypothetical protein